jgi:hypothetical protein
VSERAKAVLAQHVAGEGGLAGLQLGEALLDRALGVEPVARHHR